MAETRLLRLMVRPRARRSTRLITEPGGMVDYGDGGQIADVPLIEGLQKLASGNFDLCAGEQLTDHDVRFLEALQDRLWPSKHGHYPRYEEFA